MLAEDPLSPVGGVRMNANPSYNNTTNVLVIGRKYCKDRYKYRIYPNHIQIIKLNQLFGCCRYVDNQSN